MLSSMKKTISPLLSFSDPYVTSIEYLRGVAALLVICYHFRFLINDFFIPGLGDFFFEGAAVGIDLFFMISGFVITYSTRHPISIYAFVSKRCVRIYPLFFVCVTLFVVLSGNYSVKEYLCGLLFMAQDYSATPPFFGYHLLMPAWTLQYEVLFYALFSVGLWTSHQYRSYVTAVLLLFSTMGLQYFYAKEVSLSGYAAISNDVGILRIMSSPLFLEFILGMLLAEIYSRTPFFTFSRTAVFVSYGCVVFFCACYFSNYRGGHGLLNYGVWAFILLIGNLLLEKSGQLKSHTTLYFLGKISYSLYLVHFVVLFFFNTHVVFLSKTFNWVSLFLLLITVSIMSAYILHQWIERPSIQWLRRRLVS